MLISKLIGLKPLFKKKNGDEVTDLAKRTFDRNRVGIEGAKYYTISEELQMRADLVSQSAYSTSFLWDAILKFNGISNPFSIFAGQKILIPSQAELEKGFTNPSPIVDKATNKAVNQVLNPVTKQDKKRLEMLVTKPLPNNIVAETDRNVKVKDGTIIFGEDVTKVNKQNCSGSVSRSKLKEKLLQKIIFEE
jgi:hypothetical protein